MLNISKDEKRYSEIELDLHKKLAYENGRASIIEELEKIKKKIKNECILNELWFLDTDDLRECLGRIDAIVDKEISELKGENNG